MEKSIVLENRKNDQFAALNYALDECRLVFMNLIASCLIEGLIKVSENINDFRNIFC